MLATNISVIQCKMNKEYLIFEKVPLVISEIKAKKKSEVVYTMLKFKPLWCVRFAFRVRSLN